MPRLFKAKPAGLPPGTLLHVGKWRSAVPTITVVDYAEDYFTERQVPTLDQALPLINQHSTTWINISGLNHVDVIEQVGAHCQIHPLVLEDIVDTNQRPKMEDHGEYLFIVLKMAFDPEQGQEAAALQLSLLVGADYLISFEEADSPIFAPIYERLRAGKGRARKLGADYLAYTLIDTVVDNYFVLLENLDERLEVLEQQLIFSPDPLVLRKIHDLKADLLHLRRSVWPLREVVSALERSESNLLQEATLIYIHDIYDHTIQVIDTIDAYRDMIASMLDIYLSSVSNKMSEVMKVLTIISTIFIPLTFIAGVYGMNFRYMPELEWEWGYFFIMGLMSVVGLGMVAYFKCKRWL